jgi:short-subunit dehydrogenase
MKSKVVIITGASSGIGLATAFEFARRGAKVVMAARSVGKMNEYAATVKQLGGGVLVVKADVGCEEDCRNLIDVTIKEFGKIDILINNAGVSMRALFEDLNLEVFRKVIDTNFWGTVYCTKHALPYIIKTKGSVVAVTSITGHVPLPARTAYAASKYAIRGLFETLRMEMKRRDVHVMIAAPGFTASNIRNSALTADGQSQGESPRDEKKMMSAEEVACHIVNGVIDRRRIIILTSLGKMTSFVHKLFPAFAESIIYRQMSKEHDSPFK